MKAQLKDLWAAVKAVLGWKFLASKEHIREEESSTSSNLCSHPRKLEREEKIKFRAPELLFFLWWNQEEHHKYPTVSGTI